MKRAIATNSGLSLFQTGFTTLYEGTPLEEVFPAGEIIDEEGNVFPVPNIVSLLTKQNWNIIAQTEDAIAKGRPRQFASRSEAGRYAAQIRWGNRGNAGKPSGAGNGVPIPATNDINEAILTGAPYAPFIEENYPPEIKAICKRAEESYPSPVSLEDERLLNQYFLGHIDPKNYSEETKLAMANAEKSNFHYEGLTKEGAPFDVMRSQQAELMASQQLRKSYSVGYMKGYEAESLAYTKDHVASPNKAVSVAVHLDDLAPISASGIIKNQFHGGFIQSSGMNNTGLRAAHEAIAYGTHPLALPDRRPIYGNLHPLGVQHMYANGTSQYGAVQLVMKPEVHARSTFSVSDSLGSVRNAQPINGPITGGQPSNSIKTTQGGPQERLKRITNGQPHEYAESQIHGGVKLSDVSYIAYSASSKPSQRNTIPTRVREFAKKNGLKIVVIPNDPYGPWGIVDINGPVKKAVDAIVAKIYEAVEKGRKRRFATRTEAAQYAANIRWANNRGGDTATEEEEMASISAELSQIQLQCATYDNSRMTDVPTTISEAKYDQSPVVGKTENLAVYVGAGVEPVPSKELATLSQRTHAIGERVTGVAERRLTAKGVTPESAKKEQDEIMAKGQEKRKEEQQAHFELRKAIVRHDAQQTPESLEAKKAARTKANNLKAERETLELEWSQASYESRLMGETRGVMGELVDMGNPTRLNRLKIVGLPVRFKQEMMADLPTIFPSSVIDRTMTQQTPSGLYTLSVSKTNSQMYLGAYSRQTNSIDIASTAGTYLQLRSTAMHEFGHGVDFAHPISHALNMAFVARRLRTGHQDKVTDDITKGSFWSRPVKNPKDKAPASDDGRKAHYEDEFYRPYTGTNYSHALPITSGKSSGTSGGGYSKAFPATEVLTTGVEALFGVEKYNYRFDRDLVNHTVGVLLSISGGVIKKSVDAMDKAQSFGGDRSAAARYAAEVRWGNRGAKTESPALPDGWTVIDQITTREGTNHYELQGPRYADEGGTLTATISANSEESYVELNRVGGSKQGSIGQMRTERDEEYNIENGFPKTTHTIQNIGVEPSEQRKGYATLLLRLGRALSYNGLQIEHSPSLTEDGKGFSSAVKSEGLEKKKEGVKHFDGDRSEAARYAARIRWGNVRLKDKVRWAESIQPMDSSESDVMFDEMYRGNLPLELFTATELNEVYNGTIDTWYTDLRHGRKTPQVKKGVEAFDGVFSRALPLPRDITVYRGVQSKRLQRVLKNIPIGASFKDKSYTCTTSELSIGRRFAGMEYYGKGEKKHMLEISVRRGTKVLPMRQLVPHSSRFGMRVKENQGFQDQHYMHEFEVLLNRGAKFTVVGRRVEKGKYDGEGTLPDLIITQVVLDG